MYRAGLRAAHGWRRAVSYHSNETHLLQANTLTGQRDEIQSTRVQLRLDPLIDHQDWQKYSTDIKILLRNYRNDLLEILSLYRFHDEIDLFARCDSMDSSGSNSKSKGATEDSVIVEVESLVQRTRRTFYEQLNVERERRNCCNGPIIKDPYCQFCQRIEDPDRLCHTCFKKQRQIVCHPCLEDKLAKSACAYIVTYKESSTLPSNSNRRILSFPWIFSSYLCQLKERNRKEPIVFSSEFLVGKAFVNYLKLFKLKFKVYLSDYSTSDEHVRIEFFYRKIPSLTMNSNATQTKTQSISNVSSTQACFIEVLDDWLIKQDIFADQLIETNQKPQIPRRIWHETIVEFLTRTVENDIEMLVFDQSNRDQLFSERYQRTMAESAEHWTNDDLKDFREFFKRIESILIQRIVKRNSTTWVYLQEYIHLAQQSIAIEKSLHENWIR